MRKDMRVVVTRRMLREGLLRCLETETLSRISVSRLCQESGINRATFYNHYSSPALILQDIAQDYANQLTTIYKTNLSQPRNIDEAALEACFSYLLECKHELKILFSKNAENYLAGICLNIINEKFSSRNAFLKNRDFKNQSDDFLSSVITASGIYGLIQVWITMDLDQTPQELVEIIKQTLR